VTTFPCASGFDAFVTDQDGNPVTDLTANDFEVRESGAMQTIQQFSRVDLPLPDPNRSRLTAKPVSGPISDVMANAEEQGRIYVIVLGALSWQGAIRSTNIVKRFLDKYFDDADLAALVTLDRGGELHFTNDRTFLLSEASTGFSGRCSAQSSTTAPRAALGTSIGADLWNVGLSSVPRCSETSRGQSVTRHSDSRSVERYFPISLLRLRQAVFRTLSRAKFLSLPSTSVHGASRVLVRSTISITARS
jgi:hypothetical protein